MNRAEHLQWSKDRAVELAEEGDNQGAFASFQSDMKEHPETSDHIALQMGTMLLMSGNLNTQSEMVTWIQGFN